MFSLKLIVSVKFVFLLFAGTSGILWSVIWFALVRNSPSKQPWISAKELNYIESSLGDDLHTKVQNDNFIITDYFSNTKPPNNFATNSDMKMFCN